MEVNVEVGARKFKRKEKLLLPDLKNILIRILVITPSNTTISSFKTKGDIVVKLNELKW